MNPEIIIMLTNNDITVTNAEEVFESCKDLPAKKWGFKDIGLPKEEMIQLAKKMKDVFGCDGVNIVQNKCLGIHIFRYFKKIGEMILRQNQSVSFRRRSQIQNHTKIFIFIQRS